MKRLCDCGCRREARIEWVKPGEDPWWFGALCTIKHRDALEAQGWTDFPDIDTTTDKAALTLTGGPLDADVD